MQTSWAAKWMSPPLFSTFRCAVCCLCANCCLCPLDHCCHLQMALPTPELVATLQPGHLRCPTAVAGAGPVLPRRREAQGPGAPRRGGDPLPGGRLHLLAAR